MSVLIVCDNNDDQRPLRFVPTGRASSSEDAPGWGGGGAAIESSSEEISCAGPICWKCRNNNNNNKQQKPRCCRVCHGHGRLPAKKQPNNRLGRITKARIPFDSWQPSGPIPFGARQVAIRRTSSQDDNYVDDDDGDDNGECHDYWANLVRLADQGTNVDLDLDLDKYHHFRPPIWAPRKGEELCCLVGSWRILQCVGCHRWTTDDLLTAWVAAQEIITTSISRSCLRRLVQKKNEEANKEPEIILNYLDLGTGNASVLQMVLWAAIQQQNLAIRALGVEARSEAVQLARRSLTFNLGPDNKKAAARVEKGDFREYPFEVNAYDMITGTPPYFRVDFYMSSQKDNDHRNGNSPEDEALVVQAAIIQQGGMPTAKQSAPARCEFRGGIEAYCSVAARSLVASTGKLVVCENFINHERVQTAAAAAGLRIIKQVHVEGRTGRGILFVVYVMGHAVSNLDTKVEEMKLTVRGNDGNWTQEYLRTVMHDMSIPAFNSSQFSK